MALGLGEAESLYRAFFELKGWEPSKVDACEIWQLAVMLGVGKPTTGSGRGMLTGHALLAARVKADREGRPPPSISLVPTALPDDLPEGV